MKQAAAGLFDIRSALTCCLVLLQSWRGAARRSRPSRGLTSSSIRSPASSWPWGTPCRRRGGLPGSAAWSTVRHTDITVPSSSSSSLLVLCYISASPCTNSPWLRRTFLFYLSGQPFWERVRPAFITMVTRAWSSTCSLGPTGTTTTERETET